MRQILAIILILIGAVLYLFFRKYDGEVVQYSYAWSIAGIAIAVVGTIILLSRTRSEKRYEEEYFKHLENLKQNGEKISVEFNNCEIETNNYFEEIPKSGNYRAQGLDSTFDSENAVENVEHNQSRIIFKHEASGDTFISPILEMDKATLSFLLEKQKSTYIYLDKTDEDSFYFDLEFLED